MGRKTAPAKTPRARRPATTDPRADDLKRLRRAIRREEEIVKLARQLARKRAQADVELGKMSSAAAGGAIDRQAGRSPRS